MSEYISIMYAYKIWKNIVCTQENGVKDCLIVEKIKEEIINYDFGLNLNHG